MDLVCFNANYTIANINLASPQTFGLYLELILYREFYITTTHLNTLMMLPMEHKPTITRDILLIINIHLITLFSI